MQPADKKITRAFWESDDSCVVLLTANWFDGLPPLILKSAGLELGVPEHMHPQEVGAYYGYYEEGDHYVFVLHAADYPWLSEVKPRVYLAADFNGWGDAIGKSEWELTANNDAMGSAIYELRVSTQRISGNELFRFKYATENGDWLDVPGTVLNAVQASEGVVNFAFNPSQTGRHCFRFRTSDGYAPIGNEKVVWEEGTYKESYSLLDKERLLSASTDLQLGAIVDKGQTTFRLFAPRADAVQLAYGYQSDQSDETFVPMQCIDGVTWEVVLPENLTGAYYSFRVEGENQDGTTIFDASFAVLDPYAKACMGNFGPGIVVDAKRLRKVKKLFQAPSWEDLVILEGHVGDLVAKAPIDLTTKERQGFVGLRKWLQDKGSYIRELGVNAIELQPIQQIGDVVNTGYHWGYMTANYFSPASNYAVDPASASQIEEFRSLVQAFHDQGIAVIMDVVYNHIGEPYHLSYIDTFYFLHLNADNERVNWSGCGNDFRCDTPMARRLMIDSLKHFVEVYDVDGFRFDLAELIGIEVLSEVEAELKAVKPSLFLIAEPWSFRGHIQHNLKATGYASWNDGFRESIAQYIRGAGTADMIQYYLSGSPDTSRFAAQTVNYTESHDDYCWIDRITDNPEHDGSQPTWLDQRRTHLMASILFVALGVPMLSEGQDFMFSKSGVANTYQRGDINALDYVRRVLHSGTHDYFCDWVRFRRSDLGKALRHESTVRDGYLQFHTAPDSSAIVAIFNADRSFNAPTLIYAVNPHPESIEIQCGINVFEGAIQIADHERFNIQGLPSACIAINSGVVFLPPHSCGLWRSNE